MISLKKFESDDYDRLISWIKNEEELMQFAGPAFSFPLTTKQLQDSLSDTNRHAFKVVELTRLAVIGHAEVYINGVDTYLGRILIGDISYRGLGLGQMLVRLLVDFVFTDLKRPNLQLNVFDWNTTAIKCYQKAGFVVEPDKKVERNVNGNVWTAINMRLEKPDWEVQIKSSNANSN